MVSCAGRRWAAHGREPRTSLVIIGPFEKPGALRARRICAVVPAGFVSANSRRPPCATAGIGVNFRVTGIYHQRVTYMDYRDDPEIYFEKPSRTPAIRSRR